MKRNLLAAVGALALAWQTGAAADPISTDAPKNLSEVKTTAVQAGTAPTLPLVMAAGADNSSAVAKPAAIGPGFDCCNPCCNQCCQGGRVIGGLGLYLIQPYFENNPAITVTRIAAPGATVPEQTDRTDIHHHMVVTPELWLGYLGENGLGARLRWWYFRQGTSQSLSFPASADGPAPGNNQIQFESAGPLGFTAFGDDDTAATIAVTSKLQLQVWDLEGLQQQQAGGWDLLFSGGLRLAHIAQSFNAYVVGSGTVENPIVASVTSGHSFHGIGPTVSLQARRPMADSGLAFFGTLRGALLFGSAKQSVVDAFTFGGTTEFTTGQDHRNRVMPVGELELGVEYTRDVGAGQAFGQIALVGQDWLGAGNASRSTQDNALGIPVGSSIIDNDLGFFGFLFRVGLNY